MVYAVREMSSSPNVLTVGRAKQATFLFGVVSLLIACGGTGDEAIPTTTESVITTVSPPDETTTTVLPTAISEAVFGALSDGSIAALANVTELVTPGSPADILVRHQLSVAGFAAEADAEIAALPTTTSTTVVVDTTDASTTSTTVELGCEWTNSCTVYETPIFDNEGNLRSFSVNGTPLEQILIGPGPLVVVESVQARVVSGYRAPSGVTALIVSVTAGDEALTTFGFAAIQRPFTAENSAPVETGGAWGAEEIAAGQTGEMLLVFPDTPLDGDIVLSVVTSSSVDLELELPLITP